MHTKEDNELIHKGHRSRMRAKFSKHGAGIFDTYELLEMLLYYSIPYKDTNPLAKKLLMRFGGLKGVLHASREELLTVDGVGERTADLILSLADLDLALAVELPSSKQHKFDDYERSGEYFVRYFQEHPTVKFAMTFLDNSMRAIETVNFGDLDFNSGAFNSRMVIDLVVSEGASAVMTAQNKYYGPLCGTLSDRETVRMVNSALSDIRVKYVEHYLVMGDDFSNLSAADRYLFAGAEEVLEESRERALLGEVGEDGKV